ncbi:hypothetical protein [Algoriphagus yeomjeoni]|uniref:Glycine zipper family protein n=1 Tax=Algoriphagus yeomjeoni TaxID=291403 RepID=A0A327PKP3_9BACT|nr:hypothetical protein [Algoriphagus yeomjeoni]RAI92173.1 hypothetical protein LV83_01402 [Algoriphagus yeomjeoni]
MKIQEAYDIVERLKNKSSSKSQIKIYTSFLQILEKLKGRDFSTEEIQAIETKLDNLTLTSPHADNKKHFGKIIKDFKEYLKENHSLISAGYYSSLGVSMGGAFGVVLGVLFGERFERSSGIALGVSIGMLIGLFIGRHMDSVAVAEGKVL